MVTLPNWTPICEWYIARLVGKKGHHSRFNSKGFMSASIAHVHGSMTWEDNCMFKGFMSVSVTRVLEVGKLGGIMQL